MSAIPIGMISHPRAAAAYLVLSLILLVSWKPERRGTLLVAASLASFLWLALAAYDDWVGDRFGALVGAAEIVRTGAWIAFLFSIIPNFRTDERSGFLRYPALALGATALAALGFYLYGFVAGGEPAGAATSVILLSRLLLALAGLALVENLYRNTPPLYRWGIKFLSFAIGGIMAYDFFLYSDALLFDPEAAGSFQAAMARALRRPGVACGAGHGRPPGDR